MWQTSPFDPPAFLCDVSVSTEKRVFFLGQMAYEKIRKMRAKMVSRISRLKLERAERRLSQFDLAKLAGVTECTISRIETGRLTPAPDLKAKIATILGKPAFELFNQ